MAVNKWTREETLVALYLYYIIPFQKISKNNQLIQEYAALIGRTPSALGMKIGNLGRLDPTLKAQNISGLTNGSKMDGEVWNEFADNWDKLNEAFQVTLAEFKSRNPAAAEWSTSDIPEGKERLAMVSLRVNQNFFRSSVLAAYNNQCCITGLAQSELLIASHIKPWKDDESNRLNPKNGLCLNALHDKAFDKGLLGLDDNFKVILSPKLERTKAFDSFFKPYENQVIRLPERQSPDLELLRFHREVIFQH